MKIKILLVLVVILLVAGCSNEQKDGQVVLDDDASLEEFMGEDKPIQKEVEEKIEEPIQKEEIKEEKPVVQKKSVEYDLPEAKITGFVTSVYEFERDLSGFPNMFVGENEEEEKVFNGLLVIGSNAPVKDIISAQNVITGINNRIRRPGYIISAVMDSQVKDIRAQNAVVIGSPCKNTAAKELLGENCHAGLSKGQAMIKLFSNGENIQMVVTGYDEDETRKASEMLRDYIQYDLTGTEKILG